MVDFGYSVSGNCSVHRNRFRTCRQTQQMVYIGDSLLDAQASYAAGVPFIAFQNNDLPADLHIQALSQIPPILGLA